MSTNVGIHIVAKAAAAMASRRVIESYEAGGDGDSPIESLMFGALRYIFDNNRWFIGLEEFFQGDDEERPPQKDEFTEYVWICRQFEIDKYRVDFLARVYVTDKIFFNLIIECDGHDFHERTKKQAKLDKSRDRRLQELGYKIYHFTGSEIYCDPIGCAQQVWAWARRADL